MDPESEKLRREVSRCERGGDVDTPSRCVAGLQAGRVVNAARIGRISPEIGIAAESLRRWGPRSEPRAALVPVEVGADLGSVSADRGFGLVARAGYRIGALMIADEIELVRRLG